MEAAGFVPKENSYSFLLREAAGRGAFDEAFSTLRDMTRRSVTPRLRSYAPVLRGLCEKASVAVVASTVGGQKFVYKHQLNAMCGGGALSTRCCIIRCWCRTACASV